MAELKVADRTIAYDLIDLVPPWVEDVAALARAVGTERIHIVGESYGGRVSLVEDLHQRIAGSELQIFAGAKHGLTFSHVRPCAEALRGFLARRT